MNVIDARSWNSKHPLCDRIELLKLKLPNIKSYVRESAHAIHTPVAGQLAAQRAFYDLLG